MDKRNYSIILYDFYGELLNDKQKECFEDYYFNNLSLGEISENINLSRNAIYKNIKTSEDKLYYYEDKLNLFKNREKLYEIVDTIDDENIKNKIRRVIIMTNKKYKMIYDYRKRTSGGFLDAMFLSSLLIIGAMMVLLSLIGVK